MLRYSFPVLVKVFTQIRLLGRVSAWLSLGLFIILLRIGISSFFYWLLLDSINFVSKAVLITIVIHLLFYFLSWLILADRCLLTWVYSTRHIEVTTIENILNIFIGWYQTLWWRIFKCYAWLYKILRSLYILSYKIHIW